MGVIDVRRERGNEIDKRRGWKVSRRTVTFRCKARSFRKCEPAAMPANFGPGVVAVTED